MTAVKNKLIFFIFGLVILMFLGEVITNAIRLNKFQHFSFLAVSFLQGRLDLDGQRENLWYDSVLWAGKYYWPLGPMPALFLIPGMWVFGFWEGFFYQSYFQILLVLVTGGLVYILSRRLGNRHADSLVWVFGVVFGTVYFGIAAISASWMHAQVLATSLIFLAICEHNFRRRYGVIGLIMGLAAATRLTAGLGVVFWIMEILAGRGGRKEAAVNLASLTIPFVLVIAGLGVYNYARFGKVTEQGYKYQTLVIPELAAAREMGIFFWKHLPTNVYYLWAAVPQPVFASEKTRVMVFPYVKQDWWGLAWWVTSPFLLKLFFLRKWDGFVWRAMLTSGVIMLPIMFYYGVGYMQFGYRYSMDWLPFWLWVVMRDTAKNGKGLSGRMRAVIFGSGVLNYYLLVT